MNNLISLPPPTRISIGTAMIDGKRVEVTMHPEWARFFDTLTNQVVDSSIGVAGLAGSTVALLDSDGGDIEFIPGPPGIQGQPGNTAALFMLHDSDSSDSFMLGGMPTQPVQASDTAFTAQTTITVTHNFGKRPVVNVIDNTGSVVVPLAIVHNSMDAFTVTFSVATTGNIISVA